MPFHWCQCGWTWHRSPDGLRLFIDAVGWDCHFELDSELAAGLGDA
jgi:hypothetical protein